MLALSAFQILREASQHRNARLAVVAAEMIQATTGHPPEPGQSFTVRR